jgi:hypothetical protein
MKSLEVVTETVLLSLAFTPVPSKVFDDPLMVFQLNTTFASSDLPVKITAKGEESGVKLSIFGSTEGGGSPGPTPLAPPSLGLQDTKIIRTNNMLILKALNFFII